MELHKSSVLNLKLLQRKTTYLGKLEQHFALQVLCPCSTNNAFRMDPLSGTSDSRLGIANCYYDLILFSPHMIVNVCCGPQVIYFVNSAEQCGSCKSQICRGWQTELLTGIITNRWTEIHLWRRFRGEKGSVIYGHRKRLTSPDVSQWVYEDIMKMSLLCHYSLINAMQNIVAD